MILKVMQNILNIKVLNYTILIFIQVVTIPRTGLYCTECPNRPFLVIKTKDLQSLMFNPLTAKLFILNFHPL